VRAWRAYGSTFDLHVGPDGKNISAGVEHKLVDDGAGGWLIASSAYDPHDFARPPDFRKPGGDSSGRQARLALLRMAGSPGAQRIGAKPSDTGPLRGHIDLPADARAGDDSAAVWLFSNIPDAKHCNRTGRSLPSSVSRQPNSRACTTSTPSPARPVGPASTASWI
jgi:hypothetical protein